MTAAACVVMGLLTGCNDKEAPAPVSTPKQSQNAQTPPAAPEKPAQVIDTSVPLNQYPVSYTHLTLPTSDLV